MTNRDVYEYNDGVRLRNRLKEDKKAKQDAAKVKRKARLKKAHAALDRFRDYAQGGTSDASPPDKGQPYHYVRRANPVKPRAKTTKAKPNGLSGTALQAARREPGRPKAKPKGYANEYADFLSSPTKRNAKKPAKRNEDDAGFDYLR